ncbi:hypothetical protein ACNKHX_18945 [Shigella flexneri]
MAAFYAERARHGVALIVSGGIAPDLTGVGMEGGECSTTPARSHTIAPLPKRYIRKAANSPANFAYLGATATNRIWSSSALQAPINRFVPHELTHEEILQLIHDFAHCAQLARRQDTTV